MAQCRVHNILVIVILCVAVLLISGIALPRLFSKQYFEARSELNGHSNTLELQSEELTPAREGLGNASLNTILSNESILLTTELPKKSIRFETNKSTVNTKKRLKRQASYENGKLYTWNFNLNVTRYENPNHPMPLDGDKHDTPHSTEDKNYLGMAIYVQGKGPKRNYGELQNAWGSVNNLVRNIFGDSRENLITQLETNPKDQDLFSTSGSVQTESDLETTRNPNIVEFNEGSGDASAQPNGREGRFIFNIFKFGKALTKTTQFPEKGIVETTESPLIFVTTQTDGNSFRNDKDLSEVDFEKSEAVSEVEKTSLKESVILKPKNSVGTENILDFNASESSNDSSINQFQLNFSETDECSDCNFESFGLSTISNQANESGEDKLLDKIPQPTESLFNDEQLEKFCMNLVNLLGETQRFMSGDNKSGLEKGINKHPSQSSSSKNPQILDISSLLNALEESKSNSEPDIVEESFLFSSKSSISEVPELAENQERESRFLNIFGFGSGRSALDEKDEINELASNEQTSVPTEMEILPSALDCASYFRKKQNLKFPKPNLMDMINDPNIKLIDFANATISPKLKEQQLQFLTDLLKNILNTTSDKSDVNSENVITNIVHHEDTTISLEENKAGLSANEIETSAKENLTIISTESSNFSWKDKELLEAGINTQFQHGTRVTETQRDGKFLSIFGFGSGDGRSEAEPLKKDGRFFPGIFSFGSGEGRLLESSEGVSEFGINVLGSEDSFQESSFFSGDDGTFPRSEKADATGQERIFSFLGLGSGDGRQLNEDSELIQTEIPLVEDGCESDCSFEIHNITDQSQGCSDNECNIENPHDHGFTTESSEMDCQSDCSDISNLSNETVLSFENCSDCTQKHEIPRKDNLLNENVSYVECDECGFIANKPEIGYEDIKKDLSSQGCTDNECNIENPHNHGFTTESSEMDCQNDCSDISNLSNETVLSFESCSDCSQKHEVPKKDNLLNENVSYVECDECGFIANKPEIGYEDMKKDLSMEIGSNYKNVSSINYSSDENNCEDCNSSDLYDKELNSKTKLSEIVLNADKSSNKFVTEDVFTDPQYLVKSDQKTEKPGIISETIFLSGSGDGDLSEERDGGGPINLIEGNSKRPPDLSPRNILDDGDTQNPGEMKEVTVATNLMQKESTIIPNILFSGRRGKLLEEIDHENRETVVTVPDSQIQESTVEPQTRPSRRRGKLLDEVDEGNVKEISLREQVNISQDGSTVRPVTSFGRRGRLDDEVVINLNLESQEKNNPDLEIFSRSITSTDERTLNSTSGPLRTISGKVSKTEASVTLSSEVFSKSSVNSITTDPQPRFCTSASECRVALNEKCVYKSSSSICDCARAFVRQKETGKCVAKVVLEASLKLPAEEFDEDLRNPESQRFKKISKNANDTMWMLLKDTPELIPIVAEVGVVGFRSGSLIVSWNLVLAAEKESEAELIKYVEKDLKKALRNDSLVEKAPLDVRNASLLSVANSMDPCTSTELNYCSENAFCIRNTGIPGGFICRCKAGYLDASSSQMYPGEVCEALCPTDYCGSHGHCEFLEGEGRRCLCIGWYFGDRCEISGVVVVASFSTNLFLLVLVVFLVITCKGRCRKNPGRTHIFQRTDELGSQSMPGRVSDVIALEENVGARVAKFANISTPVQDPPSILITRPSIVESSISLDGDSTFDVTPSSGEFQNSMENHQETPTSVGVQFI